MLFLFHLSGAAKNIRLLSAIKVNSYGRKVYDGSASTSLDYYEEARHATFITV